MVLEVKVDDGQDWLELELQPPRGGKLSMRQITEFVDVTGISWEQFSAVVTARANLQRAQAGEPVPHNKSVEQLESELRMLSAGVNMPKAMACLIWLRYRSRNPHFTFDHVLDMDADDFAKLSAEVQAMEAARQEGGDDPKVLPEPNIGGGH